jgi:protein O-mannose beta-1,4-N-acetylglucosaminyltransferase
MSILSGGFYYFFSRTKQKEEEINESLSKQSVLLKELSSKLSQISTSPPIESPEKREVPNEHEAVKNPPQPKLPEEVPPSTKNLTKSDKEGKEVDGDEEEEEKEEFSRLVIFNELPSSTIACFGKNVTQRYCLIRNLCFDPRRDNFFIIRKGGTIAFNARETNDTRLLDGTSIDQHNKFYFDYVERDAAEPSLQNIKVHLVEKQSFIFSRFHRLNIMHTIHDDFLGMYVMHRMVGHADPKDPSRPFSLDNHLFFLDNYGNESYDNIYQLLSKHTPQKRAFWRAADAPLCFSEAVVGNSKVLSWYHYGFLIPQAPLDKPTDGLLIREAADYMMKELKIPGWDSNAVGRAIETLHLKFLHRLRDGRARDYWTDFSDSTAVIAIFVRTRDRLILNLKELEEELKTAYGLPVVQIRMEDMKFEEQVSILRKSIIAIGMHGSALILGMFLPPGALLVELFPYRVPAENYTPYKTMARLHGMRLAYKSWVNIHPEKNIAHPNKTADVGGIVHLPAEEQKRIIDLGTVPTHLCCKDPVWLYRIYQDTIVDINELLRVIDEGLTESHDIVNDKKPLYQVAPAGVEHLYCETVQRPDEEEAYDLKVSWSLPWNNVPAPEYGLWVHQIFAELVSNTTSLTLEHCEFGQDYDLWVRPHSINKLTQEKVIGVYTDKFTCKCAPGAQALREPK